MMTFQKPSDTERQQLIIDALAPFAGSAGYSELWTLTDRLFDMALKPDELLHDDVDNPPIHHTTVLLHMMEIAKGLSGRGEFDWKQVKQAAAISILHDICPVARVTKEMIDKASEQERPALQKKRKESVPVHMREGAKMARAKLVELNRQMPVFSAQDIDAICAIIAIHDEPKLNTKIPRDNLMAVAFREADRLWMVTPAGVRSDLARKQKKDSTVDPDDPNEQLAQAGHNIERFKEERTIYDASADGPFQDTLTFFRTQEGFSIYKRYLGQWGASFS